VDPIPKVLKGVSGILATTLKNAIQGSICRINVAIEVKNIFMQSLKKNLYQTDENNLRKVFPTAINTVMDLVLSRMNTILI